MKSTHSLSICALVQKDDNWFFSGLLFHTLSSQALKGLPRDIIQLSTKFGVFLAGSAMAVRGDPEYVRRACEDSLRRLDVEYIDLYYQHRVDKNTPIEATVSVWTAWYLSFSHQLIYIGESQETSSNPE